MNVLLNQNFFGFFMYQKGTGQLGDYPGIVVCGLRKRMC